jgi:hypothetical protein
MKLLPFFVLFLVFGALACAAETPPSVPTQNGRLSKVRLLGAVRTSVRDSPDGIAFHFLVARTLAATGRFTLRETRDFLLAGSSYQQKTKNELGEVFEPRTTIDDAAAFLALHPDLRASAPESVKNAVVLSVAIGGAKLPNDGTVEVTLHVGYDKTIESFKFKVAIPPAKAE